MKNITQWHRLIRIFPKEVRSTLSFITSLNINHCTCSSKAPPRITLEEAHLAFVSGTSSTQFLIIPFTLFYDLTFTSQVVHNRGHGFSKRFIPAGVYKVEVPGVPRGSSSFTTRTVRPITCTISSLPWKAGWVGAVSTSPSLRTFQDHQWR